MTEDTAIWIGIAATISSAFLAGLFLGYVVGLLHYWKIYKGKDNV